MQGIEKALTINMATESDLRDLSQGINTNIHGVQHSVSEALLQPRTRWCAPQTSAWTKWTSRSTK